MICILQMWENSEFFTSSFFNGRWNRYHLCLHAKIEINKSSCKPTGSPSLRLTALYSIILILMQMQKRKCLWKVKRRSHMLQKALWVNTSKRRLPLSFQDVSLSTMIILFSCLTSPWHPQWCTETLHFTFTLTCRSVERKNSTLRTGIKFYDPLAKNRPYK